MLGTCNKSRGKTFKITQHSSFSVAMFYGTGLCSELISSLNVFLYFFAYCAAVHDQVVPAGSSSRVIVHVDLDCFYAQVEMISNPELKGKPLGNFGL